VEKESPLFRLIKLLVLVFCCAVVVQLLCIVFILLLLGTSDIAVVSLDFLMSNHPLLGKFLLGMSSIATFILPVWLLGKWDKESDLYFAQLRLRSPIVWLAVLGIMITSLPVMDSIATWNKNIQLPDVLREIELWMTAKEQEMAKLTARIVIDTTWLGLASNLFIMALIPAIAEEYFFRGALQRICKEWTGNAHLAIWIVAFIFSAIHLQFYGFFPRLLLGAYFGYLLYWTNNLWVPIIGHFFNNGMITIMAFYYARQGKSFTDLADSTPYSPWIYVASLIFTVIFVGVQQKVAVRNNYGKRVD